MIQPPLQGATPGIADDTSLLSSYNTTFHSGAMAFSITHEIHFRLQISALAVRGCLRQATPKVKIAWEHPKEDTRTQNTQRD